MSTDQKDTGSTADVAENSAESTSSEKGIHISQKELDELGALLTTFRDTIIAHEHRLNTVESFLTHAINAAQPAAEVAKPKLTVVGNTEAAVADMEAEGAPPTD